MERLPDRPSYPLRMRVTVALAVSEDTDNGLRLRAEVTRRTVWPVVAAGGGLGVAIGGAVLAASLLGPAGLPVAFGTMVVGLVVGCVGGNEMMKARDFNHRRTEEQLVEWWPPGGSGYREATAGGVRGSGRTLPLEAVKGLLLDNEFPLSVPGGLWRIIVQTPGESLELLPPFLGPREAVLRPVAALARRCAARLQLRAHREAALEEVDPGAPDVPVAYA